MRWHIRRGRPAGDCRNSLVVEREHFGKAGVLVAGNQYRPGLSLQGSDSNLLPALTVGSLNGGVQAAQVHIRRNNKGHPVKDSVPDRDLCGLVLVLQRGLCQTAAVVRLRHDLKLHRSGVVAGEKMNWKLNTPISASIGNQLGIGLGISLQFGENVLIAFAGKKEGTPCAWEPGGLVGESGQFIC